MKKLKFIFLSVLVVMCAWLFSACFDKEVKTDGILVSEESITLRLNESVEVNVEISPENATNKSFELFGYNTNVISTQIDVKNMKFTITANSQIINDERQTTLGVRTADGTYRETYIQVNISEDEENVSTPRNFSFDGEKFVWDEVDEAKAYTISINNNKYIISNVNNILPTSYNLNIRDFEGQEVVAKIQANGKSKNLDSEFSQEYRFYIYEEPGNVNLDVNVNDETGLEQRILSWDGVEGAVSYSVLINDRVIDNVYETTIDISEELEEAKDYSIKVKTNTDLANNNFNSAYTDAISIRKLPAPDNLGIINGILRWNSVATLGAVSYDVYYTYKIDGVLHEEVETVSTTNFRLPFDIDAGIYLAKVKANGDSSATLTSDFGFEVSYTKLANVSNIRLESGNVVWDSTRYATSYKVVLSNILDEDQNVQSVIVLQNSDALQVSLDVSNFSVGDYQIQIQAVGTEDKLASNLSSLFSFTKLATPTNLQSIKEDDVCKIQWDSVKNVSGYKVFLNEEEPYFVAPTDQQKVVFEFPENAIQVGNNLVSVMAMGGKVGSMNCVNSAETLQITITKLVAPTLITTNLKSGKLAWNIVGGATSYKVLIRSIDNSDIAMNFDSSALTVTHIDFNDDEYNLPSGQFAIEVKANASTNQNVFDSDYCEQILVSKYPVEVDNKKLYVQNGSIADLENTEDYTFEYVLENSNNIKITRPTIEDYISQNLNGGAKISIQFRVVPKQIKNDEDVYFIGSNLSQKLYIQRLPNLADLSMVDGVLYYGTLYENFTDFEFILTLTAGEEEQVINNSTNPTYGFSDVDAGDYSVKVQAKSIQTGTGISNIESQPVYLNSYASSAYNFKKLAKVEDLRITSFANDYSDELSNTIYTFSNYEDEYSGSVAWSASESARSYELKFSNGVVITTTKLCETLQNSAISGGQNLTVKVRAIGNNENIISSEYTDESVTFTKLYAPQTLTITHDSYGNKVLKWTYASGQDPNSELASNMFSDFEFSFINLHKNISKNLFNSNLTVALHVIVDDAGRLYPAIDYSSADPTYEYDFSDLLYNLRSNQCRLPSNISANATLKVFAIPLNSYIFKSDTYPTSEEISKLTANVESSRNLISDCSPEVYIESLQAPAYLKMEDNVFSWSPLFYNDNEKADDALLEYRLYISTTEPKQEKVLSIRKTGSSSSAYKTIFVDSLTNPENCKLEFTKSNLNSLFGSGFYTPNVYSIRVKAISTNSSYTIGNKTIFYADSANAYSLKTEVLDNPLLSLEKGVLKWSEVQNIEKYGLYITKPNSQTVYVEFDNDVNEFDLQGDDYPAGQYKFQIVSVGDGSKTITSQLAESPIKTYSKLAVVANLKLQNGIIKYTSHSVVGSNSNQCEYTMFIRSTNQNKDKEYSNAKYDTFELASQADFPGGLQYYIRVRATGDNNTYISSELTDYCYINQNQTLPTKFETPTNLKIENGKLVWNRVSGITTYLINVSGGEYTFDAEKIGDSYDFATIPAGTYTVQVKAVGNSVYLNSSFATKSNVKKLSDIKELQLENGYIVWKNESASNYKLVINGSEKFIDSNNSEIVNGYVKYRLVGFEEGSYSLFIQNYGGNTAISSSQTATLNFEKLVTPSNLMIENEVFYFESVENALNYQIEILAKLANGTTKTIKYMPENISVFGNSVIDSVSYKTIAFSTLHEIVKGTTGNNVINEYQISVVAVGDSLNSDEINETSTYYITSNDSEPLVINKPDAPVVRYETDETNRFFGKIYWNQVENADYYKVYVNASQDSHKVLFGYDISQARTDNENGHDDYNYFIVSGKTYANVAYMDDNYSFIVVACKNKDGYDSENSNVLSELTYDVFDVSANGSEEHPYEIATEFEFNAIRYNLSANYSLSADICFEEIPNLGINKDNMFAGKFNGNNHVLSGLNNENLVVSSKNSTFNGLFGYIKTGAVVENFTFNADIYAITETENTIQLGMIAIKNYGIIHNVITNGTIATEYNYDTVAIYNAGIAVYNYGEIDSCLSTASIAPKNNLNDVYAGGICCINGNESIVATISKSGFIGNATGQFAAGIAAENYGNITECYFETDVDTESTFILSQNRGTTANFAGGLVAYMYKGTINYCYVYGKVSASTHSSQTAYAGGFVGYLKSGKIYNSYVIGYENDENLIYATGEYMDTIKVGVVVGYSENKNIGSSILCVKLGTQKIVGTGTVNGVEETTISSLKSGIQEFENYNLYFNMTNTIPKLKNSKYKGV